MAEPSPGAKTFGLTHPAEYLDKLEWEFERLMKAGRIDAREMSYHAMNLIVTGWHMTDWIYPHLPEQEKLKFPKSGKFQESIRSGSRTIAACRDVATATKHMTISSRPEPRIGTVAIPKFVPSDPSNQFQTAWHIAIDGTLRPLDDFCRDIISFWQCFLEMHNLLPELG
jgi:hypothetical protein